MLVTFQTISVQFLINMNTNIFQANTTKDFRISYL